jgi:hypothetical protein
MPSAAYNHLTHTKTHVLATLGALFRANERSACRRFSSTHHHSPLDFSKPLDAPILDKTYLYML